MRTEENSIEKMTYELIRQKDYWIKKLSDNISYDNFKSLFNRRCKNQIIERKQVSVSISPDASHQLLKVSNGSDLSLYIILLSILKSVIYIYSGNKAIRILSPVYKPSCNENTKNEFVIIQDEINDSMTIKEIILSTKQTVLDAYENQDYPFNKLMNIIFDKEDEAKLYCNTACVLDTIHNNECIKNNMEDMVISFSKDNNLITGHINFNIGNVDESLVVIS
jgi:hypothetical protein